MTGLGPVTHVFVNAKEKSWVAGPSPAMTQSGWFAYFGAYGPVPSPRPALAAPLLPGSLNFRSGEPAGGASGRWR
jgi:hypothetical protein